MCLVRNSRALLPLGARCRQDIFCWRQLSEDEPNKRDDEEGEEEEEEEEAFSFSLGGSVASMLSRHAKAEKKAAAKYATNNTHTQKKACK